MIPCVIEYDNFTPGPPIEPCHRRAEQFSKADTEHADGVLIRRRRNRQTTAVQFKMVSSRSENPVCAPPSLSEVAQRCLSNSSRVDQADRRFFSSFQRKNVERFLFPHLSPPRNPGCAVLGFVPASSVSSSSTTACSSDWSLLNICLLFYACATAKEMSCFRRLCGFSSSFFSFCSAVGCGGRLSRSYAESSDIPDGLSLKRRGVSV